MYGLTTPANFSQPCSLPPPSPSGSHLLPPSAHREPALIPLPDSLDMELRDPLVIAGSRGYAPAIKIGGARRKTRTNKSRGKDKENTNLDIADCPQKHARAIEDDEDDSRAKRGRPNGSNNYSTADVKVLLDLVKDKLPLGQKGWQLIHSKFTQRAGRNGRPHRKATLLETKFKQFVKTTKPTGDGVCPPDVTRAHELDARINERAGTRDLNNSDYDAHDDELNCNEQNVKVRSMSPLEHTAVTCATQTDTPMPRRRGAAASELLSRISGAFDPAVQQAWDEDRATRSLANTQLLSQGQQLRDANAVTEKLWTQLFDLQSRLFDAERERDLTQLHLEMIQMHQPPPKKAAHKTHHQCRPEPKQADYTYYPDGGQSVIWHSDPDTPASDASDHPPSSPQYTHPTPPPFNSTPSPRLAFRHWASRPRSRCPA
ncbi:hypothetical protein DFJ58DRAFT_661033 [Suillus subalutaceus]|uniref:uncharacterized protein n=1 Tax=Suillus subalutaceus TaxID=48586 RepID=UPI001B87DCC0|nr:uncharacterized protein DFJ58DRAFT_661033 [Suillus subalutaceus]KAG1852889.1 hypothetical protein DFJ58DRAFT_661033 [Suillus subalutaceus]